LSAELAKDRGPFGPEYRSPHLTLFRQSGRGYRQEWQSGTLDDPRFGGEDVEWDQIALDLFDYTGDSVPEVAIWKQHIGGSWVPCHLEVFKLQGSRLAR